MRSRWVREVVQAEIIGETLAREMGIPAVDEPFRIPELTPFPDPHQYATVSAGETKTVFRLLIPPEKTGFIRRIANTYYVPDQIVFDIDGKPVETPYLERSLGSISTPLEVTPWFRMKVEDKIEWRVTNKNTVDHEYEVLNEGFYVNSSEVELLFKLAGAVVG